MTQRSHAGPMDFDWDNGTGPVDPNSPFKSAIDRQQQSQLFSSLHSKRARSDYEQSPSKSSFPQLRAAAGQTTFFPRSSSPDKPLPGLPNRKVDIAFASTPRQFASARDWDNSNVFSSGGETTDNGTPYGAETTDADSEATPETRYDRGRAAWDRDMGASPSKNAGALQPRESSPRKTSPKKKRESFIGKLFQSSSSRRNDAMVGPYSHKVEKRVAKRRVKQPVKSSRRSRDESDSEDDKARRGSKQNDNKGFINGTLSSWLHLIENHPNAPTILINYLQLLSNLLLVLFCVYIAYSLWSGILGDVDKGVNEATSEAFLEVAACREDWKSFRCEDRMERTRELCESLSKCISKDPEKVARAQVSAKTFAKIFNDFAEPISLKAMAFYSALFFIFWYCTNATWNNLRVKLAPPHHPQHGMYPQQQHYPPPPATPSRQASAGALHGHYPPPGTPWNNGIGYYGPPQSGIGAYQGMLPIENGGQQGGDGGGMGGQ